MDSPIIRCPVCRETADADRVAYMAHLNKHNIWQLGRALWRIDQRAALFLGTALAVFLFVATLGFLVSIGVG